MAFCFLHRKVESRLHLGLWYTIVILFSRWPGVPTHRRYFKLPLRGVPRDTSTHCRPGVPITPRKSHLGRPRTCAQWLKLAPASLLIHRSSTEANILLSPDMPLRMVENFVVDYFLVRPVPGLPVERWRTSRRDANGARCDRQREARSVCGRWIAQWALRATMILLALLRGRLHQ